LWAADGTGATVVQYGPGSHVSHTFQEDYRTSQTWKSQIVSLDLSIRLIAFLARMWADSLL
jgi:hypothetical protein